jgi:Tfp pilus assembly protein PilV
MNIVEVLLAWFILMTVFLNFALIQEKNQVAVRHAYLKTVALMQAENMLERLRVNKTSASQQRELMEWNDENKRLLPEGVGVFKCSSICNVTVKWQERHQESISLQALVY